MDSQACQAALTLCVQTQQRNQRHRRWGKLWPRLQPQALVHQWILKHQFRSQQQLFLQQLHSQVFQGNLSRLLRQILQVLQHHLVDSRPPEARFTLLCTIGAQTSKDSYASNVAS